MGRKRARLRPAFAFPVLRVERVSVRPERVDWGLGFLQVQRLWERTQGAGVTVAIIDSGMAIHHPDLEGAVLESRDFAGSTSGVQDEVGHGTHVAGIVAARANDLGTIGVAPAAKLLNGKVVRDPRTGVFPEHVAAAIHWAADQGADLISLSVTSRRRVPDVHEAIQQAAARGVFTVCAAGNEGPRRGTVTWPAAYAETIAVGYVERKADGTLEVGLDSSVGRQVDLVAPGGDVLSTYPPNLYARATGTSMAAPFVAGVAALALAERDRRGALRPQTPDELRRLVAMNATDLYARGRDEYSGFGVVNPVGAVTA